MLSVLICGGCWDSRELDQFAFVTGIGVDYNPDEKQSDFVLQIVNTNGVGGGSSKNISQSSGQKPYLIIEKTAPSLLTGVNFMRRISTRDIFMQHNQIVVFGKDQAKEGINDFLDSFLRETDMRLEVLFFVSDTTSKDILDTQLEMEKISGIGIKRMIDDLNLYTKSYEVNVLNYVSKRLEKSISPVIPLIKATKSEKEGFSQFELTGFAVFQNDKMIGELDQEMVRGYGWINGDYTQSYLDIRNQYGHANVNIYEVKHKQKAGFTPDGKPKITIEIDIKCNLVELQGYSEVERDGIIEIIEKDAARVINEKMQLSLSKAKELHADIFEFGKRFHEQKNKEWKTMEAGWPSKFQEIVIESKIKAEITDLGEIQNSINMREEK